MSDSRETPESPDLRRVLESATYRLAHLDTEFLQREELRPVRFQLELLKPELLLQEHHVESTIVLFGGTRILERGQAEDQLTRAELSVEEAATPENRAAVARWRRVLAKSRFYDEARQFSRIVSEYGQENGERNFVIVTGGGPGIMEAANRGAHDVGAKSIGLNITLPREQLPNRYITPELCFRFHYFALRKMHFLLRARALVAFPGGFGTLDELFDALTLRQTHRMQDIPIILYGRDYWERVIDFGFLVEEGTIDEADLDLFQFAETPEDAWEEIRRHYEDGE